MSNELSLSEATLKFIKGRGDGVSLSKSSERVNIKHIPTGIFALDLALSGGIPENFITLIYGQQSKGKTLLAYKTVSGVQKKYPDKVVVWVDAEGTLKPNADWAEVNGVNLDRLYVYEPSSGEDAVDCALKFLEDEHVSLVVLDSIPALVSTKRHENSVEDQVMTEFAKLVQPLMQKGNLSLIDARKKGQSKTLLVINQWRQKAGFCLGKSSKVHLADGTKLSISKIVNNKLDVEVLSYNTMSGRVEPKKVVGWFKNGKTDKFIRVDTNGGVSGRRSFLATEDHEVYTSLGKIKTKDLKVGDLILSYYKPIYSEDQLDVVLGSLLGDGSLRKEGKSGNKSTRRILRVAHSEKQYSYLQWKCDLLNGKMHSPNKKTLVKAFYTEPTEQLVPFDSLSPKKTKVGRSIPQKFVERLNLRSVAVWYMDDGHYDKRKCGPSYRYTIACKSLTEECGIRLADKLESLGLGRPKHVIGHYLMWHGTEADKFTETLAPYIHPSMSYKIHAPKENFDFEVTKNNDLELRACLCEVIKLTESDRSTFRDSRSNKYDIEVEDNHNFFVGGLLVSNSLGDNRVLPGGNSQHFFTSLKLEVMNKEVLGKNKEGFEIVDHNEHSFKVEKYKVSNTIKTGEFTLCRNPDGELPVGTIDDFDTVANVAQRYGLLTGAGQSWNYTSALTGEVLNFKSKRETIAMLKENEEEYEAMKKYLISSFRGSIGLKPDNWY